MKIAEFRQHGQYGRYFFRYETRGVSVPVHYQYGTKLTTLLEIVVRIFRGQLTTITHVIR